MSTNPMNRARLWRRIGATVLVPAMVLVTAVLMSALTRWLDQYLAGKAAAVLLMAAVMVWIGYTVWHWPDWREDEEAPAQPDRSEES